MKIKTGIEQRTARQQLELIKENKMKFKLNPEFVRTVNSLSREKGEFSDNQLSFIDGLYEQYMKQGGFDAVSVKHDYKK